MTQYRLGALKFREIVARNEKQEPTQYRTYRQGDLIEVDGDEERRLLKAGALLPAAVKAAPVQDSTGSDDQTSGEQETLDATEPPKKAAPVDEWRAYAVSRGLPADEVATTSKQDLIEALSE